MKKKWRTNISESSFIILSIVMVFLLFLTMGIIVTTCNPTPSSGVIIPEAKPPPSELKHYKYTVESMSIGRIITCEYDLSNINNPKTIISGEFVKNKILIHEIFFVRVFDKGSLVKVNHDLFFCLESNYKRKCQSAAIIIDNYKTTK